jgi:hypothetical protein
MSGEIHLVPGKGLSIGAKYGVLGGGRTGPARIREAFRRRYSASTEAELERLVGVSEAKGV